MGGIVTGLGGSGAANGGVSGVTAAAIAAILAGQEASNSITAADAVAKISTVHASVVGADVNSNGHFDWTEKSGDSSFELATTPGLTTNDIPIDGFVLVSATGYSNTTKTHSIETTTGTTPVTPLELLF
jgi:hypothetical protein